MIDVAAVQSQYCDHLEESTIHEQSSISTPSVGAPKRRYSDLETPKAKRKDRSRLKSNEARPKLTTILETLNGSSLFPKINHYRSIEQAEDRIKLPRLPHFKSEHKKTETTGERSASIETRMETESLMTPDLVAKLSASKITTGDRNQDSRDNSELQKVIYRRKNRMQAADPEIVIQQTQEDQDEYDKHAVPGPGSYHYSFSCFDNHKHNSTRSTDVSFMSKLSRFSPIDMKTANIQSTPQEQSHPPTKCQIERQKSLLACKLSKKLVPFYSKVERMNQSELRIKEKSPGPLDYSPRASIEEDLIKRIQRHFKGSFDSGSPRFQTSEFNGHLGPGCYQLPPIPDDLINTNFYFKSKQARFV